MKLTPKPPVTSKKSNVVPLKKKGYVAPEEAPKQYADLKSVMDYTTVFDMIYSGVENESYYNILYDLGIRNFLMSYHYIQSRHINFKERFADSKVRLFIDSGAFTYMGDPKYADTTVEQWEKHIEGYLRWAEKNREYIFAIANFDLEHLVGGEVVDQWNKKYFEPFMLKTGIPVCFVWHFPSFNTWDYYCQRYPYVGYSSRNEEGGFLKLDEHRERLRTAEKHNSLVHGFAMTQTALLTELPFYTSDSTTWLVGLQYGEMNYWTSSNKMSRLKKDSWKKEHIDEICNRYSLNKDLMLSEDVTEMIKANIGAFIDATAYIQTRLKSRMYWLKAKVVKVDLNNLPDDFFPTPEWFDGNQTDIKEYAKKMNINTEYEKLNDLLYDVVAFVNWNNPKYESLKKFYSNPEQQGIIEFLHDIYINRIVPDQQTRIQDLTNFFKDCISGENDKLLQLGTNFDRMVRERESYVEDDEEELVDVSPEEIKARLQKLLPTPADAEGAPEIDALDAEIYSKVDIIPTFDEKGKLLKGQTAVRKPKKVYSNKYPKLACDTCASAQKCPEFKTGYVCAYQKMFNRFDTRDMADIIQAVQGIVEHNMSRMQRAMVMEMLNGSIDGNVSQLMDTNIRYLTMLKQLYENGSPEVLKQTKIVRADGTREEYTQITNPQGGGILEKIFGGMMSSVKEYSEEDVIDVTPKPVNERYTNLDDD
jgi:hypothetical protein